MKATAENAEFAETFRYFALDHPHHPEKPGRFDHKKKK